MGPPPRSLPGLQANEKHIKIEEDGLPVSVPNFLKDFISTSDASLGFCGAAPDPRISHKGRQSSELQRQTHTQSRKVQTTKHEATISSAWGRPQDILMLLRQKEIIYKHLRGQVACSHTFDTEIWISDKGRQSSELQRQKHRVNKRRRQSMKRQSHRHGHCPAECA